MDNEYFFDKPHIIAAYKDETFVGMFVTYEQETISKEHLIKYFGIVDPTCFVAEEIPEMDETLTPDNYVHLLDDMIAKFTENKFSDLSDPDLLYIPRTLH